MKNILVAYFSASKQTEKVAQALASVVGSDLYEIVPEIPYTKEDLDWMDKTSRSTLEMKDLNSRPKIKGRVVDMDQYDKILLGFPIWWYTAPRIINTFLESYDLSKKTIILFATSGGSGLGHTDKDLAPSCPGAIIKNGCILNGNPLKETLLSLIQG